MNRYFFVIFFLYIKVLSAQVKLDGQFYDYATYYMSNIDVSTGQSDVPLFRYRISYETYPVYSKIWFKASVLSPSLGMENRTTLIEMESNAFEMKADIVIDNRNFSTNSTSLLDEGIHPNLIPIVESPTGVDLESPGGIIADTSFNIVYTKYPVFNWNKGYCLNCETYIRVAEFKVGQHQSVEEAINDERTLPFDQSKDWLKLQDVSSFQYPMSGARPLDYGKIYVWQIKSDVPTTNGMEAQPSSIYAFKLSNPSDIGSPKVESNILAQLRTALGENRYNSIFGQDGQLEGFNQVSSISLNDATINESTLQKILRQIIDQSISIKSVEIEN